MEDDCRSVTSACSTASASLEKKPCPYCQKDFQTRYVFGHIRSKHPSEFLEACAESHLKTSKVGRPLRVYYEYKDDRGEDAHLTLYACLSGNKAYLQESRCMSYFKKNPKALKQHNAELKDLQAEYLEKEKFDPYKSKLERMRKSNNPTFCRMLWSEILYLQKVTKVIKDLLPSLNPADVSTQKGLMKYQTMTFKEAIVFIQESEDELNKLKQERCLEFRPLNELWIRYKRILSLRYDLPIHISSLWPRNEENGLGMEEPDYEFGFGNTRWEQVNF